MSELDEMDFGADTDAIRRWLAKRETYADEMRDSPGGGRHRVDPPGTVDPRRLSVPDGRDAARDVLSAIGDSPSQPSPAAPVAPPPSPSAAPSTPAAPPASPEPASTAASYAAAAQREEMMLVSRSTNTVFEPRRTAHRMVTALFCAAAVGTVAAAYVASEQRTTVSYGLAVIMAVLTLAVWAVRASTTVTELAVIRGQLEMIRDGKFEVVDLASPYTKIVVDGRPGRGRWRVLVERVDQPLLVLDRSVVDPFHFMAVLQRIRPELREDA